MNMKNNNQQEPEVIDKKEGRFATLSNTTKAFMTDIATEFTKFSKDILQSLDKSESNQHELATKDKAVIEMIIKKKLESENYSDEELKDLLDRNQKITEKAAADSNSRDTKRLELATIIAGATVAVIKIILDNRNKS